MIDRIKSLYDSGKLTPLNVYGSYIKKYITQTEWNTFYSNLPTTTFQQIKLKVFVDLEIWSDGLIDAGYSFPNKTFNLAMSFDDRNSFTQQLTLVKSLVEANIIPTSQTMTIVDIDKVSHSVTAEEILSNLPLYGVYVNTVWSTKTGYEDYINGLANNSDNKTILENITFSL